MNDIQEQHAVIETVIGTINGTGTAIGTGTVIRTGTVLEQ